MKNSNKLLIALFFAALILPTLIFALVKDGVDTENHENRELASFPDSSVHFERWPAAFDGWYIDHLPFKNQFTAANSLIQIALFNTTTSPRVVVGEDGWLFYNNYDADDNPISDILGHNEFTDAERETMLANIEAAQSARPDTQFILLIAPNKETVYREMLPEYIAENAVRQTRVEQLCDRLAERTDCLVWPEDALLEAARTQQVYYKYDTHWNLIGGYIGVKEVCEKAGVTLPELSTLEIADSGAVYPADLAALAGIQARSTDDAEYSVVGFGEDVSVTRDELNFISPATRFTSNASDERIVLFVHDSFYKSMEGYLPLVFSEVISVERNYYDLYGCHALIEEFQPDIILMEVAERGAVLLLHEDMPY